MATMLSNMQDVCLELGLPSPSTVVSNNDEAVTQLLALMNRVGATLATEHDWQALATEYRFETVFYQYTGDTTDGSTTISNLSSVTGLTTNFSVSGNGIQYDTQITAVGANSATLNIAATATATTQTFTFGQVKYAMPSDYNRIVNKTQYDKSNSWTIHGPNTAQDWQLLKSSNVVNGPNMRFRIVGDKFSILPMPESNILLGFEYISKDWVASSSGTGKAKFSADDDTSSFPDALLILGTKLKFYEIKGFDTTTLLADFARELSKWKAAESGADTLSMAPRYLSSMITKANIPQTGFGS